MNAKTVGVGLPVENIHYHNVSFGTRTVKLDSGQQMIMPNIVRTVGQSTMIEQYHQRWRKEEYQPLGRSMLYRILKVREAEQCENCDLLRNTMSSILFEVRESHDVQFCSTDQLEDLLYDTLQAQDSILQWKAHILRAANEDRVKME